MPNRTAPRRGSAAALLAAAVAAGCGGSISLGFGDDWDDPPEVSLAAAADRVRAGETLRFVAAASDDYAVDDVEFWRRDGERWTLIARDASRPYEAEVDAPDDGRTSMEVFARATDDAGQSRDSASVVVLVLP